MTDKLTWIARGWYENSYGVRRCSDHKVISACGNYWINLFDGASYVNGIPVSGDPRRGYSAKRITDGGKFKHTEWIGDAPDLVGAKALCEADHQKQNRGMS
jgi:hypothetical protein